jgi:hypothetical protein
MSLQNFGGIWGNTVVLGQTTMSAQADERWLALKLPFHQSFSRLGELENLPPKLGI